MNDRFDGILCNLNQLGSQIDALDNNMQMVLSGMALLFGNDWQERMRKMSVSAVATEMFDICSVADNQSVGEESQPDMELSPENACAFHDDADSPSACRRRLSYSDVDLSVTQECSWEPLVVEIATQTCSSADQLSLETQASLASESTDNASQTDGVHEDIHRLASLRGNCERLDEASMMPNLIVKVTQVFLSADRLPIELKVGLRGTVSRIDTEGDAEIYFPSLVCEGFFERVCVFQYDFAKLSRLLT